VSFWTPSRLDVLVEMAEDGAAPVRIAEVLGCTIERVTLRMTTLELITRSDQIKLPPKGWKPDLLNTKYYP